jgi:lipid A 3-O-deacylase
MAGFRCLGIDWLPDTIWMVALILTMAGSGYGYAADPAPSASAILEVRIGLAAHDVDGLWSGESKEDGPDICAEVIFNRKLAHLFSLAAYPHLGASVNTRGDTSKIYGGVLVQWEPAADFFFSTGLGIAVHDGKRDTHSADRKSLGSRVLFRIPIEFGYAINYHHRVALAFDHISNAYLASPNEGMDTLGLVYGYRF